MGASGISRGRGGILRPIPILASSKTGAARPFHNFGTIEEGNLFSTNHNPILSKTALDEYSFFIPKILGISRRVFAAGCKIDSGGGIRDAFTKGKRNWGKICL